MKTTKTVDYNNRGCGGNGNGFRLDAFVFHPLSESINHKRYSARCRLAFTQKKKIKKNRLN